MTIHASPAEEAWDRLLGRLADAGRVVSGPTGARTGRERAEGYRHLTRVLAIASEMLLEKGDPAHPAFTRWMTPYRKMYGDNPGTIYDAAVIAGASTYRIAGHRGSCAYLGFCVYGTMPDGGKRIVANLDDDELEVAADGSFELWLAPTRPDDLPAGAAFLALDPDTTEVMVRQYFVDPESETPASYTIQAVPDPGPPPAPTEQQIAARLDAVGAYVHDTVEAETTLSALSSSISTAVFRFGAEYVDSAGSVVDPVVDPAAVVRVMPTPAIQYSGQWFDDLADDEVLVIEGTAPACRYWSVQLLTRFMESGDWLHHPVARSGRDIKTDADGRFRIVVAHRDPGVPNWLATTGLTSGTVAVRALKADGVLDVRFTRRPLPLEVTTMTSHEISGRTVTMPVQVRDASAGTALFEVDAAAAEALLPTAAFEVVTVAPGRAHLALAVVDYRDNDLGAYREVGIMLFVAPRGAGRDADGTFVLRLPVDQPFTCEAGRRIWGFPKTVEQIDVESGDGSTTWTLSMDGELVLRLQLPRGGADEMPALPMTAYTLLDGVPHATRFRQGGTGGQVRLGADGVRLELGAHPVGKELASLGLPRPAVLSTWTERMQATFEQPRPV